MSDLNAKYHDNPISRKWEERYNEQPQYIKEKLERLDLQNISEYQLKVIKRKRIYPEKGDVFLVEPKEGIYFWGVVMNNHVCNINGEDLLVISIFKERVDNTEKIEKVDYDNLLIGPCIVGKEYWTKGYFYTIKNMDCGKCDYGFYSIGKGEYFDEYGNVLRKEPQMLGTYGVVTISGIAYKINVELIMNEAVSGELFGEV